MLKYHIQTIEVGSGGAASITFSSIPQTYDGLYLDISARSARAATNEAIRLAFNGSTTGFSDRYMDGTGSSVASGTGARYAGQAASSTSTSSTFSNVELLIPNYAGSANKSYSVNSVAENNATFAVQGIVAGLWSNTAAITSLTLTTDFANNFLQYSSASLYGIKHGTSGDVEAAADGGAITQSGGYTIHTFTSSGTFVANRDMDVEYLVVAGGGGGGLDTAAGGGAGGYRSSVVGESSGGGASAESKLRVNSGTNYLVEVGAGGSGSVSYSATGSNGGSSSFGIILSAGGGGGASGSSIVGADGGSGGGGDNTASGGSGVSGQGYSGGSGGSGTDYPGGGGGAGAVGQTGAVGNPGDGGIGVQSSINGSATYRAGGGGGSSGSLASAGSGGLGGGARGAQSTETSGQSATANTGGGGGGGGNYDPRTGGNGGSGVVIIRYPTPA